MNYLHRESARMGEAFEQTGGIFFVRELVDGVGGNGHLWRACEAFYSVYVTMAQPMFSSQSRMESRMKNQTQNKKGLPLSSNPLKYMAERKGFEPSVVLPTHDFQSCSFGQLGHLSARALT